MMGAKGNCFGDYPFFLRFNEIEQKNYKNVLLVLPTKKTTPRINLTPPKFSLTLDYSE